MKIRKATVFALAMMLTLAWVASANAYCVYNKTNETIAVKQTKGHKSFKGMNVFIEPGKRACCNWENDDCNKVGERDSKVAFKVTYYRRSLTGSTKTICNDKYIKAGGWLNVTGRYPDGQCEGHF